MPSAEIREIGMLRKMEEGVSKEIELARIAAKGVFHLFAARVVSRVIGVAGGLVLIRLLKPEEYGLMAIAVVLSGILGLFKDPGVGAAVTKFTAEYRTRGKYGKIRQLIASALLFRLVLGVALSSICFVMADAFASSALGKPYIAPLMRVAAFSILAWSLFYFASSAFMGFDRTRECGMLLILQEAFAAVLPIVLVLLGMGVAGAILGNVLAAAIPGTIGVLAVLALSGRVSGGWRGSVRLWEGLKTVFAYGLPLAAAGLIGAGLNSYYNYMIAAYCIPEDIGYYSAAGFVSALLGYLSFPISAVLFPAFSKIDSKEEHEALRRVFTYSVKYSSLIVLPAAALMLALARPLTRLLFGRAYEAAWLYLALMAVGGLYYGNGGEHMGSLLSAQGETRFMMKMSALNAALGVPVGFVLISNYGILGMLVMVLAIGWPGYFIVLRRVYNNYGIKPPFKGVAGIYVSSAISGLLAMLPPHLCSNDILEVVAGVLICVLTYIMAISVTKAVNKHDLEILREITEPLPVIGRVMNKMLKVWRALMT